MPTKLTQHHPMPTAALAVALCLCAGPALGARCDKIEYAEAKDMKVEELERTFCAYFKSGKDTIALRTKLINIGMSPFDKRVAELTADAEGCFDAAGALDRVIKNVHGRPSPPCAAAPTASAPVPPSNASGATTAKSIPGESRYMFEAERLAKSTGCAAPVAAMNFKGAGTELFTVTCSTGDLLSIRCDDGVCHIMK